MTEPRKIKQKQVNQFGIIKVSHDGGHALKKRFDPQA
jgi:hypothetical protein